MITFCGFVHSRYVDEFLVSSCCLATRHLIGAYVTNVHFSRRKYIYQDSNCEACGHKLLWLNEGLLLWLWLVCVRLFHRQNLQHTAMSTTNSVHQSIIKGIFFHKTIIYDKQQMIITQRSRIELDLYA